MLFHLEENSYKCVAVENRTEDAWETIWALYYCTIVLGGKIVILIISQWNLIDQWWIVIVRNQNYKKIENIGQFGLNVSWHRVGLVN